MSLASAYALGGFHLLRRPPDRRRADEPTSLSTDFLKVWKLMKKLSDKELAVHDDQKQIAAASS